MDYHGLVRVRLVRLEFPGIGGGEMECREQRGCGQKNGVFHIWIPFLDVNMFFERVHRIRRIVSKNLSTQTGKNQAAIRKKRDIILFFMDFGMFFREKLVRAY